MASLTSAATAPGRPPIPLLSSIEAASPMGFPLCPPTERLGSGAPLVPDTGGDALESAPGRRPTHRRIRGDGARSAPEAARSSDLDDLGGWCLILPEGDTHGTDGPALREALAPLLAHRAAQGYDVTVLTYPVSRAAQLTEEESRAWMEPPSEDQTVPATLARADWVMLAGHPRDLPLTLYQRLSTRFATGYLCLEAYATPGETPAHSPYRRYVERLLREERRPPSGARPELVLFGSGRGAACQLSHRLLLRPLGAPTTSEVLGPQGEGLLVKARLGADATQANLLEALQTEARQLLITAGHGEDHHTYAGPLHGALIDDRRRKIDPKHFEGGPCTNGGVAILFGCNTAGTPRERRWNRAYQLSFAAIPGPDADILSQTPQAMLLGDRGPLAVLAHADIILTLDLDLTTRFSPPVSAFHGVIRRLLKGQPIGAAHRALKDVQSQAMLDLLYREARQRALDAAFVTDWSRWSNALGWMVLGDPTARLR